VPGYEADLDAIAAAAAALRDTTEALSTAARHLDGEVCASLGPGRLGPVTADLTSAAREDLDRVLAAIVEDARLAGEAGSGYANLDQAAADSLTRRAGDG
jgi:hypothetical protein